MAGKDGKTLKDRIEREGTAAAAADQPLSAKVEKTRTRKRSYLIDLRIHSPSSLGYLNIDRIDTAPALVRLAKVKGLDVIAVTDYNTAEYLDRVKAAAAESHMTVLPGVVIRCAVPGCDDVVLSCLFAEETPTQRIRDLLTALEVPPAARGKKNYVVRLPFEKVLETIEQCGGIAVPSRMDKTPYRKAVIKTLVEEYGFRAFDLAYYPDSIQYFKQTWPKVKFQMFNFSSATALAQIGNRHSRVKLPAPGFEGIKTLAVRERAAA